MNNDDNARDIAEKIDILVGTEHLRTLELGEEVMSPTGELVRKRPSAAMLGKMQQYAQMHGVAEKASGLAASIQDKLRRMQNPRPLRLTGTDGKNALVAEDE